MNVYCTKIVYDQFHNGMKPSDKYCCFNPYFEFGEINKDIFSSKRHKQIEKLIADKWTYISIVKKSDWKNLPLIQSQIIEEAINDNELFIWHDNSINELLTFIYLCWLFKDKNVPVYSVSPKNKGTEIPWHTVDIYDYEKFKIEALQLTDSLLIDYSNQWLNLTKSDDLLRFKQKAMIINGETDYYDKIIKNALPDGLFYGSKIIRNLIKDYNAFDAFLPFIEKRLCLILREECQYNLIPDKEKKDAPLLYSSTFIKLNM